MKRILRKFVKISIVLAIIIAVIVITINSVVNRSTKNQVFNNTQEIPFNKVGMVLGTSKYLRNGHENLYYKYRIEAAVRLYESGKINFILISGDNSTKSYNEPSMIRKDLIKKGIPKNRIYLDYAGFRTFDSVIRSKKVFSQYKLTIISQQFHNKRAIFIANFNGIEAVGYNAKGVGAGYGYKTMFREHLARTKMTLDLLFNNKPKFLGEKIEIK